ncbi:MAG: hypothetical protein GX939_05550, partial [Clostridiaceae bacterium]|nr:hypothetical protein [Clostridiaceae bacterium]
AESADTDDFVEIEAPDSLQDLDSSTESDVADWMDEADMETIESDAADLAELPDIIEPTDIDNSTESDVADWPDEADMESVEADVADVVDTLEDTAESADTDDFVEIEAPDSLLDIDSSTKPINIDNTMDVATDVLLPREYDDFEKSVLEERPDFYESGAFFEQGVNEFGYGNTCGPTSMASGLNALFNTNEFTENKMLKVAKENDLCLTDAPKTVDCGATTTSQLMELYDKVNEQLEGKIDTELYDFEDVLDVDTVADRVDEGSIVTVAVDSKALWGQRNRFVDALGVPWGRKVVTDHWITVKSVERNDIGNVTGFNIIDSGGGMDYVDVDKYREICYGTDNRRTADPTAIVVSKKETVSAFEKTDN